ncbi:cell division ATP-binding protein FtsE [Oceanobacillus timonensis]|uniref:cell division ATP-binding protein FtsE n=1 Tax=Oceanobacillus timonensis TaxID=1926285 RepID=UPI0009BBAFCB|nr:cell division ATP-binding protein FtsE [Oceanobacillus timonensis]
MITMENVSKTYSNGVTALNDINIHIDRGEFVYLVGPSGAGKSSFIRLIYREAKPTKGKIIINGRDLSQIKERHIPYLRRDIGVVFQDFKLLQKLTIYENVAFALEVIETSPKSIKHRVAEVLQLVGLEDKAKMIPSELSGGEQQRVAIARAIVNNPKVVIADEPTGNLDPDTSWGIMQVLDDINSKGTTVIMATHSKHIVNTIKRRVIAIEDGNVVRDQQRGDYGYEV